MTPLEDAMRRYIQVFRQMPPLLIWSASNAQLVALMELALASGKPLTEADIAHFIGEAALEPKPQSGPPAQP